MVEQFESLQTAALAALPGVTPALLTARQEKPENTDLPILPIAASVAAVALLMGLYFIGRARRRTANA